MTLLLTPIGTPLRGLWRWWIGEIAAMVPARLWRWIGAMRRHRLLIIGESTAELVYESGGRREHLATVASKLGGNAGQIRAKSGARGVNVDATIRLPAERGLRSLITLPLAAAGNLPQAVGFALERHTPFKRSDVYFAHRIVQRDNRARNLLVELTVVPRALVDEALLLAQSLGLNPLGVNVAAVPGTSAPSPNLLPEKPRGLARSFPDLIFGFFFIAALGLLVAALLIPLWEAHRAADALALRVAEAKHQADASLKLQTEIDAVARDAQFLVARRQQTRSVSELLADLTHLLPDDTWLTELQITTSDVQMTGFAKSATELLTSLDRATGFTNAAFRASVTQDAKLGREQFDITAKLVPKGER